MTFLLQHFADEPVAMRTKVAMINDHIFPNLTTSPYNFDQTGDLSAVREGCEPGSRQLKGQASDQRVNRGLASNDHPGSFAGHVGVSCQEMLIKAEQLLCPISRRKSA